MVSSPRLARWLTLALWIGLPGWPTALLAQEAALPATPITEGEALEEEPPSSVAGKISLQGLQPGDRVEVDGAPLVAGSRTVVVEAGLHLVTVFPRSAAPLELFVEVDPGRTLGVLRPPPLLPRRDLSKGAPATLGSAGVTLFAAGSWWILARKTDRALDALGRRTDLDPALLATVIDEAQARRRRREGMAVAFLVAGALLAGTGATLLLLPGAGEDPVPGLTVVGMW